MSESLNPTITFGSLIFDSLFDNEYPNQEYCNYLRSLDNNGNFSNCRIKNLNQAYQEMVNIDITHLVEILKLQGEKQQFLHNFIVKLGDFTQKIILQKGQNSSIENRWGYFSVVKEFIMFLSRCAENFDSPEFIVTWKDKCNELRGTINRLDGQENDKTEYITAKDEMLKMIVN